MGSWRVFTKRLLALPLRERPSSLFHMIANEKASFEDDDSALKLIKTCFWHQEGFSLLNNEELFAALWIVASKVHPPTANQIFTDMYKNAREKCRLIMLFWAWWANYSHLGGKKDDAVRICEKGLTLITQDRQVLEDIKNAILNGKPISLSEPSLPSTAVPLTNGVDENAAIDTSAARQQLSKLTLSDERRVLDSLDVQRHEAAATGVAKPAAGSVSKNSDVVIKDDSKSDNALLSSIEKLIRQENKKTGDEIFQALEEQNRRSKAAEDQLCTMVQSFAELNSKMSEMTQKMDEMSQLIVTLRDENLQASGIPLKKKRATSEAYNDGETGVFGSSRIGFLSTVDMEDKSAKKEVVKAAAPALHNGIPADCDMSMTRCDLATNSAEPARGAPGGIDHPLMDPENAAGFIQQRRTTGTSANLGSALRHPQSLSTPETTNRNSASSNSRATTGYGKQQSLIPRDSEEVTPEPSPAIAARKPMDRMPRDSVCVRAHQNQRQGSNSLRNMVSDGLSLPPAHSIQTSTPFEKCADQPPTLNMSIIAPRGFSCSPINEEEDEPLDFKNVTFL